MRCFLILLAVALAHAKISSVNDCMTPDNRKGDCVKLHDCPPILQLSNDFTTPMTVDRLHFLINSMCGFQDKAPKVCCPLHHNNIL